MENLLNIHRRQNFAILETTPVRVALSGCDISNHCFYFHRNIIPILLSSLFIWDSDSATEFLRDSYM